MQIRHPILKYSLHTISGRPSRGAHNKNIPSHPIVEYHPYTREHYSIQQHMFWFKLSRHDYSKMHYSITRASLLVSKLVRLWVKLILILSRILIQFEVRFFIKNIATDLSVIIEWECKIGSYCQLMDMILFLLFQNNFSFQLHEICVSLIHSIKNFPEQLVGRWFVWFVSEFLCNLS